MMSSLKFIKREYILCINTFYSIILTYDRKPMYAECVAYKLLREDSIEEKD